MTQLTWSMHYQNVWLERSASATLPTWLRVASLAYGTHLGNGHASFGPGEVRLTLGRVDEQGELVLPDPSDVSRAIRTAVKNAWLATGSRARCLIVPPHAISGGRGGKGVA